MYRKETLRFVMLRQQVKCGCVVMLSERRLKVFCLLFGR
jgi:hypothetical protein